MKLYTRGYYFFSRRDASEFQRISEMYLRTIALLQGHIREKKILEIGSAKGYFLALLQECEWSVQGVEVSPEASVFARSAFGIPTFTGTIGEYISHEQSKQFPLVAAIDVIEHVSDPREFLKNIHEVLQQDGLLIIDTPNARARNIEFTQSLWEGFNPFHIYLFSIEHLQKLLVDIGYTVLEAFSYGNMEYRELPLLSRFGVLGRFKLKSLLTQTRLLVPTMLAYHYWQRLQRTETDDYTVFFRKAREYIETAGSYWQSPDRSATLSTNCRGDNIVIIARKLCKRC